MLYSLLASADKTRTVGVGEAALYALLGFLVVFIGITFLIFVVWLVGKIVGSIEMKIQEKQAETTAESPQVNAENVDDELSEETLAVITAALMAYYQKNNPKCEFTVKRIKRI
jgi:sodium pump decarboxylase gamma subunit